MPGREVRNSEHKAEQMYVGGLFIGFPTIEEATMACQHAIAQVRVDKWWESEQKRNPSGDAILACHCCGAPLAAGLTVCRYCNVDDLTQSQLPWYLAGDEQP